MKKFFINIVDDETETYPVEGWNKITISRKQYTELLCNIHEIASINALLEYQLFSCGQCRSFSVTAHSLYVILTKIVQQADIAEIISYNLKKYIEEDDDFEFPYEECVFVFDPRCSCSRILRS
ncbi:MAG: hypothetical protein NTY00_02275 [Deltaproteobacteria bacterium]|nr:hypothetical protein [Deltaproteobacteria bacterium]